MNIKWILLGISIAISVCPIATALLAYRNNIEALVIPEIPDFMKDSPEVKYLDYQTNPPALRFRIRNPYNITLTFNSIEAELFCADHNVCIGSVHQSGSVTVSANSQTTIGLLIIITSQGTQHLVQQHFGMSSINVYLKNLEVDVQGVKLHFKSSINVGSIPIPYP